ncbi:hypothetical protein BYT27DRAFT_7247755 [Phlegmacium glaucopus]|nr:hypothetical protein BYT27DRAFT_7247755 [Phlegmacium glaucopus]
MPSEVNFKKHAETTREALKNFNTVWHLNAPALTKLALEELVSLTVNFNEFVPFFVAHPLFQEIPPAVQNAVQDFSAKNPAVGLPEHTPHIAGLVARIKDSLAPPAKKVSVAAANLHPEKIKRIKTTTLGKHPRLSKEFINSDDDVAAFLNSPNTVPSIISSSKPSTSKEKASIDPIPMEIDHDNAMRPSVAITVLAKQQPAPTPAIPVTRAYLNSDPIVTDPNVRTGFLTASDLDIIERARNIVTDSIMAEIGHEDPQGHIEFEHAVRHQIVSFCQRIRASLLVVDHLMVIYNTSVAKHPQN